MIQNGVDLQIIQPTENALFGHTKNTGQKSQRNPFWMMRITITASAIQPQRNTTISVVFGWKETTGAASAANTAMEQRTASRTLSRVIFFDLFIVHSPLLR